MKKSQLRKIIRESIKEIDIHLIKNIFGKFFKDETINTSELQLGIDNLDPEAVKVVQNLLNSPKYKKRIKKTKISDDKEGEERLNEGPLCCVGKGGCCEYDLIFDDEHDSGGHGGGGIEWKGCCNQGWPKECCGGVTHTWKTEPAAQDLDKEITEIKKIVREEIKKLTLNEKWWCCGGRRGGCCTCTAIGQEIEGRIGDVSWDCCCEGNARKRRCCGGSSGQIRPITNINDVPIELRDLER